MLKHLYELELIPIKILHYKNWLSKSSGKFSLEKKCLSYSEKKSHLFWICILSN